MSGSAAISRAKSRRGNPQEQVSNQPVYNSQIKEPINIDSNTLLMKHDYKLFIFENRLRELYELSRNNENNETINTDNNLLSQALQTLDSRIETLEANYTNTLTSNSSNDQINKLDNEQKELKNLILKMQTLTMETNLKVMQLKETQKKILEKIEVNNETQDNSIDLKNKSNIKLDISDTNTETNELLENTTEVNNSKNKSKNKK